MKITTSLFDLNKALQYIGTYVLLSLISLTQVFAQIPTNDECSGAITMPITISCASSTGYMDDATPSLVPAPNYILNFWQ